MAFSFGGGQAPAPAPSTGFSFGGTAPAPAPSGGFNFASAPAPATTGGFGAPAPTTSFGGFGAPAPAPATASGFGSFGAAPAPSSGLFGATPAPSTSLFGAPALSAFGGGGFGAPQQQQPVQQQQQVRPPAIAGYMRYDQVSPEGKRMIDEIAQKLMNHKRTMNMVASMAPHSLHNKELQNRIAELRREADRIQQDTQSVASTLQKLQTNAEQILGHVMIHAVWPTEAMLVRAGLPTDKSSSTQDEKKDDAQQQQEMINRKMRSVMDNLVKDVDQINVMPSPYLIATITDHRTRLEQLELLAEELKRRYDFLAELVADPKNEYFHLTAMVYRQNTVLSRLSEIIKELHRQAGDVFYQYASVERGQNVLEQARAEEWHRQRQMEQQAQYQYLQAAAAANAAGAATTQQTNAFGGQPAPAPASTGTGLFGSTAPALSGFAFSSPAPAPAGGGLFGGGTFGAPAPTSGTMFTGFGAPAPAPGTGFGSFTAAPATTGGSRSSSINSKKKKGSNRWTS